MQLLQKLGHVWEKFQAFYCRYLGRNYKCGCGHTTKWKTILTIHGHEGVFKAPSKKPDYCPYCWAKAAIKCAWCSDTILPGDAITLYTPREKDFVITPHAVVYQKEPRLQLVGCLGWNCADTGADRSGFWVMPGKVQRVASPFEMLMATGGTDPIIVGDLTDPRESTPIPDETADNQ